MPAATLGYFPAWQNRLRLTNAAREKERKKGVKSCKSQSGSGSALEAKMDTQLACLTRSEGPSKGRSQSPQPAFLLKPTTGTIYNMLDLKMLNYEAKADPKEFHHYVGCEHLSWSIGKMVSPPMKGGGCVIFLGIKHLKPFRTSVIRIVTFTSFDWIWIWW